MLERRRFLRSASAAAVCALPALPARAASPLSTDPEPQLDALYGRFMRSVADVEAAIERSRQVSDAVQYPDQPAAACAQPGDYDLDLTRYAGPPVAFGLGRYIDCRELRHLAGARGFYPAGTNGRAVGDRAAEILAALKDHREACQQARDAVGADEAEDDMVEAWSVAKGHALALATAQAATFTGVLMKAKAIVAAEMDAHGLSDWRADILDNARDSSTALAVSLTLDLMRLCGLAPAGTASI